MRTRYRPRCMVRDDHGRRCGLRRGHLGTHLVHYTRITDQHTVVRCWP